MSNSDKLTNIFNKVEDIIDTKNGHLFVSNELVASQKTFKDIKTYVKANYDAPEKDLKGYIIRVKIDKNYKTPLSITCMQVTITPKLFIKSEDDDGIQTFNYTPDELLKYKFSMTHLKKIMKAIKNDAVSYRKTSIPISDILK